MYEVPFVERHDHRAILLGFSSKACHLILLNGEPGSASSVIQLGQYPAQFVGALEKVLKEEEHEQWAKLDSSVTFYIKRISGLAFSLKFNVNSLEFAIIAKDAELWRLRTALKDYF